MLFCAHLTKRASTKIARVVFFGFTAHEHANIADVVADHFDVDVPDDVRALGASLRDDAT